jgi:DNA processing protein
MIADFYTFPARNRIIAGLSPATVVLEAPEGSGALITADFALEEGRDVFVVPGQIFDESYAGSHAYLAKGQAHVASDPLQILRSMGVVPSDEPAVIFTSSSPDEAAVYGALSGVPSSLDDLVERSRLATSTIGMALTMLELQGAVKNVGGGQWVRA